MIWLEEMVAHQEGGDAFSPSASSDDGLSLSASHHPFVFAVAAGTRGRKRETGAPNRQKKQARPDGLCDNV